MLNLNPCVADLMPNNYWNLDLLNCLFSYEVALNVSRINLAMNVYDDKWCWWIENNDLVSSKSASRCITRSYAPSLIKFLQWRVIWNLPIGPGVKHFAWKLFHTRLEDWNVKLKFQHVRH
ncbi:universal stress protein 5 [Canna indica]|uniref:Universal stress protein 5 n=1 Tax=Canna indica TaxID=4628 RepID=A0AAQ3L6Y1_9LILI|nr:universal stress protein 5 [Canna indica]